MAFFWEFEWDPAKARSNLKKHSVFFERAIQVFQDPLALTIPDEGQDDAEARWITLGKDWGGRFVLVFHTVDESSDESGRIRVISARTPTRVEVSAYEETE